MINVVALVEGKAELLFVSGVLRAYLEPIGVRIKPILMGDPASMRRGGGDGGVRRWKATLPEILRVLKSGAICTTMFDFYGMPSDRPAREMLLLCRGRSGLSTSSRPWQRKSPQQREMFLTRNGSSPMCDCTSSRPSCLPSHWRSPPLLRNGQSPRVLRKSTASFSRCSDPPVIPKRSMTDAITVRPTRSCASLTSSQSPVEGRPTSRELTAR